MSLWDVIARTARKVSPGSEVSDQIVALSARSSPEDWRRSSGQLHYRPDGRVWFYLDYTAWRLGGADVQVEGMEAHRVLWDIYDLLGRRGADEARAALAAAAAPAPPAPAPARPAPAIREGWVYPTGSGDLVGPMYQITGDPAGAWYAKGRRGDWFSDGRSMHSFAEENLILESGRPADG